MAASILEDMSRSVALLQGLPDQQNRVDSITTFKKELEEQLTPKLQTAFQSNNESQQLILHKIYSHLDLESQFVSAFCQFHSTAFSQLFSFASLTHSILSSSIADSPFDTLQSFYPNLHTWFLSISEPLFTLFGDQDEGGRFIGVSSQRSSRRSSTPAAAPSRRNSAVCWTPCPWRA